MDKETIFNKLQNKIDQIDKESKGYKVFKTLTNKYLITSILFLSFIVFFGKNNLTDWGKDFYFKYQQEKIISTYRKDMERLDIRIQELSSNRDSLEKFAREQYYFHEKDEDIFIVNFE